MCYVQAVNGECYHFIMVNIDQYISVLKIDVNKDIFSRLFKSVQNPDLQEVMLDSTI
ncbi:transposase ISFTu2, partial [Francisella tularensis subsp. tularensis 70001275]